MTSHGFDLATREMCIDYQQPALPGDELEIATWLSEVTPNWAVRHTTIGVFRMASYWRRPARAGGVLT